MNPTPWQRELEAMEGAARRAGVAVMRYFRPGAAVAGEAGVTLKGPDNPLTKADLEADSLLRRELLAAFPDHGWLSEETADDPRRLHRERVWVVDPIDGTKEYILGLPQFAISVALVDQGRPVAGCVFNPATDELFAAVAGRGARLNGEPLAVTRRTELEGALCLASRSELKRGEWERFRDRFTLETMGSIAYKLACVAAGRHDLTFTLVPKNEWDFCAGELLVREAGGEVSDKGGGRFRYNRPDPRVRAVLATNGLLHPPLLELLREVPHAPDRRG